MTTYMELDRCQVLCGCRRTVPLCKLYFCRHCLDLRCSECVSHEVDSHYCPNCLENMASAEAKMRKHRCGNCFDCPSCGHTLSTRATAVMLARPDDPGKTMAQKAYYLTCGFCRWSTRDSDIPDQRQSAGGWQESANPYSKRISELVDSYHHLAVREKADREWSKFVRKRNYMILLERYPVLNPRLRRYCSSSWTTPSREAEPVKQVNIPAAEAPDEPVAFDLDSYINQPLQLEKITTVFQRHLAPHLQPKRTSELEPHPKCLVVKRSMRCRTCEHNLSKADFNPSSIKFRINLSAVLHVPEIRYILLLPQPSEETAGKKGHGIQRRTSTTLAVMKEQRLIHRDFSPGKKQNIVLTICNPAHRVTTVSLRQLTAEEEMRTLGHLVSCLDPNDKPKNAEHLAESDAGGKTKDDEAKSTGSTDPTNPPAGSSGDTPTETAHCFSTVKLSLPTGELKLAPRNDIADYDEGLPSNLLSDYKDDPRVVAFRRGNKIGLHVGLTPFADYRSFPRPLTNLCPLMEEGNEDQENVNSDENLVPLRAAVRFTFDYKNTTTTLLSEHRAAALASPAGAVIPPAVVAPSPNKADTKQKDSETSKSLSSTSSPSLPRPPGSEQINEIQMTVLLYFGDMPLKN
ncbi:unnamed protein product [Calicophoron daubneyi]|uniref:Dynactin subunit 4 n=1 Tax=Calicophoron daubneyi TaxID=300641 RepID=A0AAV2SZX7_CALDB